MYRGIALSVLSSILFAGLYLFPTLLKPLNGEQVFGWRLLLMLPCITPFMLTGDNWRDVVAILRRLRDTPGLLGGLVLSSALLGFQQWLFMWAPLNGHGLDVSLGYFLLPLTLVLAGRLFYGERLTALQTVAACLAALGVMHQCYLAGGFSKETLAVALGYPVYFIVRRKIKTESLAGLWIDLLLALLPAACFVAGTDIPASALVPRLYFLIIALAMISTAAFVSYTVASHLLPLGLFGLLGYVEPILMLIVALLIGEHIANGEWLTYIPIWIAIGILALDGLVKMARSPDSRDRGRHGSYEASR